MLKFFKALREKKLQKEKVKDEAFKQMFQDEAYDAILSTIASSFK